MEKIKFRDLTAQQLANKIGEWEYEIGESFTDRFLDDSVTDRTWVGYLFGRGYTDRANHLISLMNKSKYNISCLQLKFQPNSTFIDGEEGDYATDMGEDFEELYEKDLLLWAQFILDCEILNKKAEEFFKV